MTTIDLGEVTHEEAAPAVPLNVRRLATALLAVVAVAGASALGGSARPAPPAVRPLWTVPLTYGASFRLGDDAAYVAAPAFDGARISAHDLATGATRWSVTIDEDVSGSEPVPIAGVVLIGVDPSQVEKQADAVYWMQWSRATVALDPATGAERWRTAGEITSIENGLGLVSEFGDDAALIRLRLVRLADGHELWNVPTPGTSRWTVTADGDPVTASAAGEIRLVRRADGAVRRPGRLPWPAGTAIYSVGRYVSVVRQATGVTTTTVYRPGDLRELWRADQAAGYLITCGALICEAAPGGVSARDAETGEVLWKYPGLPDVREAGPSRLLLNDGPVGTQLLVDAATGRMLGAPALGTAVTGGPDGSLLILRGTQTPYLRSKVIRFDLTTGAQRTLGTTAPIGEGFCSAAGNYLACPHEGTLTVTAVG